MERVIFGIDTESRNTALQRHLQRMTTIQGKMHFIEMQLFKGVYDFSTGNPVDELKNLISQKAEELTAELSAQRKLIVFGHQINLPPKKYS